MNALSLVILLTGISGAVLKCSATHIHRDDAFLSVPELIEKYGYPVEVHHVQTEDGYILEMHRIPYGVRDGAGPSKHKPVVIVQHGLLSSSADWVIPGPKKGLAYLLADLGYDVWLGNNRGNKYSKQHISMDPSMRAFWDYSWHEIGVYDLPAMIDYALQISGQKKTFYIGYSQGTTAFYVMCSQRPEYNQKIRAMFSMAPIAYMNHMSSRLLKIIAKFERGIKVLFKVIGVNEFLPSNSFLSRAGGTVCGGNFVARSVCKNSLIALSGFKVTQINMELLPVIMGHTPAGASTKQLLHFAQGINSGIFRQYDYGFRNIIKYRSLYPPKYDINKVTVPVALFYSYNDCLAAEIDVLRLYNQLANPIGLFLVTDEYFNHLDYLWGRDVDTLVYNKVFTMMENY